MEFLASPGRAARRDLGREKKVLTVTSHPRADAQLGVAIAGGRIDVIDAVAQQHVEGSVSIGLACARQRCSAEQGHRAGMARPSKYSLFDHGAISVRSTAISNFTRAATRGACAMRRS